MQGRMIPAEVFETDLQSVDKPWSSLGEAGGPLGYSGGLSLKQIYHLLYIGTAL